MNAYSKGDVVRVEFQFRNETTLVDPAVVLFKFKMEGSTSVTTYQYGVDVQVVKQDTGSYYVDIDADSSGCVLYRAYATGSGKSATEGGFLVRSRF